MFVATFALAPAALHAQDVVEARVPVATRNLPRGAVLTEADIALRPAPAAASGEEAAAVPSPGWVTRRTIAAGEALREPAVGKPVLVAAGQRVEVVWSEPGLELRVRGAAVGSAGLGERVLVKIDSKRRLEGVASGPGLVHIQRTP